MERTFRKIECKMGLKEIKQDLKIIGDRLISSPNGMDCYLFGSILKTPKTANDIDVLIVYENKEQLNILKQEFKSIAINYPLHVNYFTFLEEKELDFIKQQNAEIIFRL